MTEPRRYAGTIVGHPHPFARARGNGAARYNPERYKVWKEAAGYAGLGIRRGRNLLEGPLGIELVVTPDGIAFEVYELGVGPSRSTLRGDLDNYAKAILDALQHGVLYTDDKQIETITVHFSTDLEEITP